MRQFESIFWGVIAALGALFVQLITYIIYSFTQPTATLTFTAFFTLPKIIVLGAFIEEALKYLVIAKVIDRYSLEKTYIINSLLIGLGFFATELGLIFYSAALPSPQTITELAIIHLGTAGCIGYLVAVRNPKKIMTFIFSMTVAVFFHSVYNALTLNRNFLFNYFIFALLGILAAANLVNLARISKKLAS